ncbi:hypothetical protein COCON_G00072030 [Conger conger]|uniref:Uncharacterized protein n=1 Tax=Conger conger TaxID=82655 RepID=A0A9Q1I136_CONCO|nr:hypothetical protein COCON_G00072030 [Conger conger]
MRTEHVLSGEIRRKSVTKRSAARGVAHIAQGNAFGGVMILPPSSRGFQLRNLVSSADYRLCVVAVFEEVGVGSVTGVRVLGCASFSTREDFLRCRTLHAHFLGGALSVLVGGAVVVMLLVITVATMVRHHQHQWACGRHDADEGRVRCRGRSRVGEGHAQGAESPLLIAKGTSVYSQTNGEGGVMMVVLPKAPSDRPAARRIPPYSPESQRATLYYPGPASCTLPSARRPRPLSPAPAAAPRTNRSCSFDMGEVTTATRHGYGKPPGSVWSGRRPSLQSMLVPCTSPAHNTNRDELEESVV